MANDLNPHQKWMTMALKLAQEASARGEIPVGSVIVKDDVLVSSSYNEVEALSDVTAHAEMLAIGRACQSVGNKYLSGCTIYVTLEPCPMCAGALVWSKIDRIVFAAMDPKAGACGSLFNIASSPHLNHRIDIVQGVLEEESERLLKTFFQARRTS